MTKSTVDDALSSLAPLLRVRPELQDFCRFGGDWGSSHDAGQPGWAYFHIVLSENSHRVLGAPHRRISR